MLVETNRGIKVFDRVLEVIQVQIDEAALKKESG